MYSVLRLVECQNDYFFTSVKLGHNITTISVVDSVVNNIYLPQHLLLFCCERGSLFAKVIKRTF